MKTTISLLSLIFLMSCVSTQSNIKIDSIETFNLDNYNDFNIKINDTNLSAEVNPIDFRGIIFPPLTPSSAVIT